MTRIAIVGMACRYPDAASPEQLWENVLAGRRAFRRLPDVRMRLADYWDPDPSTPDRFYADTAAVLEGYEFDRVAYRVAGSTYRSTDLTHWLALDTAARALADAGHPAADGLPRERTGVVVGNTLTGEFTRAHQLRLRWPYVRRTLAGALREEGWGDDRLAPFLSALEAKYKQPFPAVDEDTLAGGLSNTIAGRICNHFDLGGGGYTVDGACSSSLLSVITAARALADDELDVAVAGGVDLSIDPFEMIGFAKTGALARHEMRVYDRRSNGFWPGEGAGMVVLMREEDARAQGCRVYAAITGWGVSSDGRGGITRPELAGYRLALRRAYARVGYGVETVGLFEGHGTGTAVGDANELRALSSVRRDADPGAPLAAIGTIKAMIGHTKAAAGVAGLIKATLATYHGVLPPTVGCVDPHPELTAPGAALRVLDNAEEWPDGAPVRAGVSAMGFGGINTHVALEASGPRARAEAGRTTVIAGTRQDAEVLLVDADTAVALAERLALLADAAAHLSYAQLTDLAVALRAELRERAFRAAVVADVPQAAAQSLRYAADQLREGTTRLLDEGRRVFAGRVGGPARIGLLFPGQGSGSGTSGGALSRRFPQAAEVFRYARLPVGADTVATAVAQPRIAAGSVAGLCALAALGVDGHVAVGHSLGELTALHWAGAMDAKTLLRIARVRGEAMTRHSAPGAMASLGAPVAAVAALLTDEPVVVAGHNGPRQTVVAGPAEAVDRVCARAGAAGIGCNRLPVSHAFHSPLVAPSAAHLAEALAEERFTAVSRPVLSTVTGEPLDPGTDVVELLRRQVTAPVLFAEAVAQAAARVDLFIEVGPGHVLTGLAREITDVPCLAMDTDSGSLAGFLAAVGAAYVAGAPVDHAALFEGRLSRPLPAGAPSFLSSPCEAAPIVDLAGPAAEVDAPGQPATATRADESTVDLLCRLAAERAELPADSIGPDSRLLDELHLSSITVASLMDQAARELGLAGLAAPTAFATATIRELADALDALAATDRPDDHGRQPVTGAADWTRAFVVELDAVPVPDRGAREADAAWLAVGGADDDLTAPLRRALDSAGLGEGVLVCLPEAGTVDDVLPALEAAKIAAGRGAGRFVVTQCGAGAAALARTLRLEAPGVRTTVVHLPDGYDVTRAVAATVAEVAATTAFTEAHYDRDWVRYVPTMRALPPLRAPEAPLLGAGDVMLVTGGGKGITAECARALAAGSGAAVAIIGRSAPDNDTELAANLDRLRAAGLRTCYRRADVTDPAAVTAAIAELRAELGPVSVVLHGAGRNQPATIGALDRDAMRGAYDTKVAGLDIVLAALDPDRIRMLITFGSIIGRTGLRGEAHYATANDWLAERTAGYAARHPHWRCLCVEWSVWSGVGMGERLAVVESLAREGVTPLTVEHGVDALRALLADPATPTVAVVAGRLPDIDTVRVERPALPLLRFLERPLVRVHGVELVSEVRLSAGADPYLSDHEFDGNLLFPAVLGLEAMAQVAAATLGRRDVPALVDVAFARPVVVPKDADLSIRVAATVTGPGRVAVCVRSAETGYAVDHFRATAVYGAAADPRDPARYPDPPQSGLPLVALDPMTQLYGTVMFQGKRFHRLLRYRRADARHVDADIAVDGRSPWFGPFLPADLLLGDPGMRDALMHGNQVCVPDATLLPIGVASVEPYGLPDGEPEISYTAVEREQYGNEYVYDIVARTNSGAIVERWRGLRLRAVRTPGPARAWVAPLLGPYLERAVGAGLGADIAVNVEPDGDGERRTHTALGLARCLGHPCVVRYRPDGRPEVDGYAVSSAHGAGLTFSVAAHGTVTCDVQPVAARGDAWPGLLGGGYAVAGEVAACTGEPADTAATRVWCAIECLRKAGASTAVPLTLDAADPGGDWVSLRAGDLRIATYPARLTGRAETVVFAILAARPGPGTDEGRR